MFVKNNTHTQLPLVDFTSHMPKRTKERFLSGWAPKFYELVFSNINEDNFKNMYSTRISRSNFPVNILVSLEIIKGLFNYTDLELLDAFHMNIEVMWAVGLRNFGQLELAEKTLYDFRNRILRYKEETGIDLIEDTFYELVDVFLKKTKIKTNIQRMDSTMINANIKKIRRYELLWLIIRNLINELTVEEQNIVPKELMELTEKDAKKKLYDRSYDKATKQETLDFLASGLITLKVLFEENERVRTLKEFENLMRVVDEQVDIVEDKIIARDPKKTESDTLQSPYDTDATYRKKSGKEYQGYIGNFTETCNKDNKVQLITAISVAKNVVADQTLLKEDLRKINTEKALVDGGYDAPESYKAAKEEGIELIATKIKGRELKQKGNILEFEIEEDKEIKRCPAGEIPYKGKYYENQRYYKDWFKKEQCNNCSQRDKCPLYEQQQSNYVIIRKSSFKTIAHMELKETAEYEEYKNMRAGIECTMSELKRRHKLGQVYSKSLIRVSHFVVLKTIACNFKRVNKFCRRALLIIYIMKKWLKKDILCQFSQRKRLISL